MTRSAILLFASAALLAACADTAVPPPAIVPQAEDRHLIDPRAGFGPIAPDVERRFETIWRHALAGDDAEARRRIAELRRRNPDFPPATLVEAFLDIRAGRLDVARATVESVLRTHPDYLAARVYQAEIAFRANETRLAHQLYRDLAARPDAPPSARERLAELQARLFGDLFEAAKVAPDDAEAIRLLREALTFDPSSHDARILLARKLVAQRGFDEARRELEPLLATAAVDNPEVQELLAEIDVGRGRYQEAIVRYDRLTRRTRDPRHAQRLAEIKEEWSLANMPAHYREALDSTAVTRADFAVLLYWTVPSVRFAQNLGSPPIAIDIADVAGRDEIVRAMALGLYDIDPVTRRVSPFRQVTADRLSRHLARILTLRGAACARGMAADEVLAACRIPDPLATHPPDATITGREAQRLLAEVAKALQ